ncbi:MAG TPA: PHB depolymerase family esterase [Rhizomicrobium sp.]
MANRTAILAATVAMVATAAHATETQRYGGRDMLVHVPVHMASANDRALVIVLHGGLGNASRIESERSETGMNLDAIADRYGFVVAYLNGTPVTRRLGDKFLGWNAGACCGQSSANNIDDVGYIKGAVNDLIARYGIPRSRVFGMGHSNGAMMTLRMMCETNVYAAAISISGALETADQTCPDARGKRILAIHGADDANVPVAGGEGRGLSRTDYNSEAYTSGIFRNSGVRYELKILPGADHALDHIDAVLQKSEGMTVAQQVVRFFGLDKP